MPVLDFSECFDLFFTGVRGARVHAIYLRPKLRTNKLPAVLQFHGYKQHSGSWTSKLSLVAQGICVAALDCRGQFGISEDVGGPNFNTINGHIIRGIETIIKKILIVLTKN